MKRLYESLTARKLIVLSLTVAFISAAVFCTVLVYRNGKHRAIDDAKAKALILLEQNQALLNHFRDEIRPKIMGLSQNISPDAFDPAIMSSFHIIRQVNESYNKAGGQRYYYKICALNALNPQNEADSLEAEVIRSFNLQQKPEEYRAVREIAGDPYFVVMRPGNKVKEACLQCHSTPEAAPKELVARYGRERGFGWRVGEIISAYSIRIPLIDEFNAAYKFSLKLSLVFTVILLGLCILMAWLGNWLIFKPLSAVRAKAAQIADTPEEYLGEEIALPSGAELRSLTTSFNSMSRALRTERDLLEDRVRRRTAQLQAATEELEAELLERRRMEEARERLVVDLQNALSQVKTLRGLLPICSYCKKIRDDQGYWNSVEKYIHERSTVEFSHGICPDCLQEHHPEYCGNK